MVELAHRDNLFAGEALLAFARGRDEELPDLPLVGGLLLAEFLHQVRAALGVKSG